MNGDLSPRDKPPKDIPSKKPDERVSPRSDASSHGSVGPSNKHPREVTHYKP